MAKLTPQPSGKLVRLFEKLGFAVSRRKAGDHIVLRKDGCPRPLVIPDYREVPVFIIQNLMRTAGLSREEFFKLLSEL